jgi:Cu/Ag efflux protein CusF
MNAKLIVTAMLAGFLATVNVSAQADDQLSADAIKTALASVPRDLQAQIVGIDTGSRTISLKGAKGHIVPVAVSPQVTNFNTLKIGDRVDVLIKEALLLRAVKSNVADAGLRKRVDTTAIAPASDASGFGAAKEVEIIATVQKIDEKKKTITLRGPWHTDTFGLPPELAAQKLKAGDSVHVVFISATAVQVTPVGK